MTRVKICGIRSIQEARWATEAGAWAIGFVLAPSPRQLSVDKVAWIIRELPPSINKVGVFVDTPIETVKAIIDETGINILQFHGQESPEYCQEWSLPVIKSFSIQDENSLANIEKYQVFAYLMDTFAPNSPGGTGKTFDWGFIDDINPNLHLILAGGLNPGNAARAICRVRPFAVDVSSGVETSGRKDHGLIHEFVRQAQIDCAKRQDNCERW